MIKTEKETEIPLADFQVSLAAQASDMTDTETRGWGRSSLAHLMCELPLCLFHTWEGRGLLRSLTRKAPGGGGWGGVGGLEKGTQQD